MTVGTGEVVHPVTTGTRPFGNGDHPGPVMRILEHGGVNGTDMAIATLILMYRHRVARRVTTDTEGGV